MTPRPIRQMRSGSARVKLLDFGRLLLSSTQPHSSSLALKCMRRQARRAGFSSTITAGSSSQDRDPGKNLRLAEARKTARGKGPDGRAGRENDCPSGQKDPREDESPEEK